MEKRDDATIAPFEERRHHSSVIFETESPEQYTEFIRDVAAPQLTTLLGNQPTAVQARVWEKVTDAYRRFQGADGRVHTENQAIWLKGLK